jgi:hypothetical protein
MKIKAINSQTASFLEKVLQPEAGIPGECLIGRNPECGLVLNSPEVSPVHGRIVFQQGRYYYNDLGSIDGSRVNNQAILVNQGYSLKAGDIIRISCFVLLIEEESLNSDRSTPQPMGKWSELELITPRRNLTCLPNPGVNLLLTSAGSGITRILP